MLNIFFPLSPALQPVGLCDQTVRHAEPDLHRALHRGDDSQAHGFQSEGNDFTLCDSSPVQSSDLLCQKQWWKKKFSDYLLKVKGRNTRVKKYFITCKSPGFKMLL